MSTTTKIQFADQITEPKKVRLFVFLVIVTILAGSVILVSLTRQVRLGMAHEELINALKIGSPADQQRTLDSYKANLAMGSTITKVLSPFSGDPEYKKQIAVESLFSIINKIALNDFTNASLLFRDAVKPNIKNILAVMPFDQLDHNLFRTVMSQSEKWITDVSELAQLEVQAPGALKRDKSKIEEQSSLALDLINSFAEFLGLQPISDLAGTSITFYQKGVLEGLPMLAQIPDDVKDLKELKYILDGLGVEVAVKGDNAPQVFEKKLAELKSASLVFKNQIESLSTNITNIKTNRDKLRLDVYQSALAVRSDLIQLLEVITKPKMNFVADAIFALISE